MGLERQRLTDAELAHYASIGDVEHLFPTREALIAFIIRALADAHHMAVELQERREDDRRI